MPSSSSAQNESSAVYGEKRVADPSRFGKHALDQDKPMMQRMLDGELYLYKVPEIMEQQAKNEEWLHRYNNSLPLSIQQREEILRERIGTLGAGSCIRPPFYCEYGFNIHIGKGVCVNFGCHLLDVCQISIGDLTMIGPSVQIYTPDHPRDAETRLSGWEYGKPVTIGKNVWIGGGAILLPGITVGDNAKIGAGSVVTKDVPPNTIVAGSPARPIKTNGRQ